LKWWTKDQKLKFSKDCLDLRHCINFHLLFLLFNLFSQPPAKNKKIRYNILISMTWAKSSDIISWKMGTFGIFCPKELWFFFHFFFLFEKGWKKILRKSRWNCPRMLFLLCWRNHPDYSANLNIYGKPFEACQLQESVQDTQ